MSRPEVTDSLSKALEKYIDPHMESGQGHGI